VVVENENFYASEVPPSNLTTAIAVETTPTHCGFNAAEVVAGWESLREWSAVARSPGLKTFKTPASSLLATHWQWVPAGSTRTS